MKRNQKGFVPVIIILVVLIGFVGVYCLGTLKNKPVTTNPSSSPVATTTDSSMPAIPTVKPTADPTVNWKTYINNKCGYSLKYPTSWNLSPEDETGAVGVATITTSGLTAQIGCGNLVANESPELALERLNSRDTGYGISKFESISKIEVSGKTTYKQINIPNVGSKVLEYYIFYQKAKVLNLGFTPAENKYIQEIDQILSTFKFTN